jgi:hypothetical protein
MKYALPIASLLALACIAAAFIFIAPPHGEERSTITEYNDQYSKGPYSELQQYVLSAGHGLRRPYAALVLAFEDPSGSAKRKVHVAAADRDAKYMRYFLDGTKIFSRMNSAETVRADISAALDAWVPLRRDVEYALNNCEILGHMVEGRSIVKEPAYYSPDALHCTAGYDRGRIAVAKDDAASYFAALRRLDADAQFSPMQLAPQYDLANNYQYWIFGEPKNYTPPPEAYVQASPHVEATQ